MSNLMYDYIFYTLKTHSKENTALTAALAACVIAAEINRRLQARAIKKLAKEIEELKRNKGE